MRKVSDVHAVPIAKIYRDTKWNCRGDIDEVAVLSLARSIKKSGLIQPIVLRSRQPGRDDHIPSEYEYIIVSGHRRHRACEVNGAAEIDAIIRDGLSEIQYRSINVKENLDRQDLTLFQEANALVPYVAASLSDYEISKEIGRSVIWVKTRVALLSMPPQIQEFANANLLTPADVIELQKFSGEEQLKRAGVMRDARKRQDGKAMLVHLRKPDKSTARKVRKKQELLALQTELQVIFSHMQRKMVPSNVIFSASGNSLATRVIAWATGVISTGELRQDISFLLQELEKCENC